MDESRAGEAEVIDLKELLRQLNEVAPLRQSHARLLAASAAVVAGIDQWNESVQKVIRRQPAYRWGGLEELRAAVAEAEALHGE